MKIKENIKQVKQKKEKFDILWDNPKYKAIIKLSIWFVLILILSLIVRLKGTDNQILEPEPIEIEKTLKQQLKDINNYEAIVYIDDEITKQKIIDNQQIIEYQENIYYDNDNTNEFINKIKYFNIKNIYELIENIEEEYTTNYKDGNFITNYKVSSQLLLEKYQNEILENNNFIDITIEGNKQINKITIKLDNIEQIEFESIIIQLINEEDIKE